MDTTSLNFHFTVRVSKPGYDDVNLNDGMNVKAEHWMPVTKRVPYNAFKLYMLFGSCNDREAYAFNNLFVHAKLGFSLNGSYDKAFKELMEAGYVHRYGVWDRGGEVLYDFSLVPMSDSEYYEFIDNYYAW